MLSLDQKTKIYVDWYDAQIHVLEIHNYLDARLVNSIPYANLTINQALNQYVYSLLYRNGSIKMYETEFYWQATHTLGYTEITVQL